jgi:hypothetical protein
VDIIDATGVRPAFDLPTLILFAVGLAMAVRRRREPMVIAALCCVAIIPLPAVLQRGSITRQPLGAAPFAMFFAALPLAAIWRAGWESHERWRLPATSVIAAIVVVITAITVYDYFWTWRRAELVRFVYHAEITAASSYMRTLPPGDDILFYSDRHPISLETRQFLAPGVRGTDRSSEFSSFNGSIQIDDRSRPVVFVLLGRYRTLLPELEETYPGGRTVEVMHDGVTEFLAYELPPAP